MATAPGQHVGLYITCLADLFRPEIGFATVKLLEQCGCSVSVPLQSCCGQPAYNSGDRAKASQLAKEVIRTLEPFDSLVVPSGSCAAMIRHHYPSLLEDEKEWSARARAVGDRTFELSEFLVDEMGLETIPQSRTGLNTRRVTYHDSCSGLREMGIREQPRRLLSQCAGIRLEEMHNAEICCGFGGTFCVKYPEISTRMVDNKISGIEDTQAEIVLGGDLGCLMNIAGRLKRHGKSPRVYHYAELLVGEPSPNGIAENDG